MESTISDTIVPEVYLVDKLPFWPSGTKLATINVVDMRQIPKCLESVYKYIDVPFPERQPLGNRWIETLPAQIDYYCLPDEVDKFIQYFVENGCSVSEATYFTKEEPKYKVSWKNPSVRDVLISLVQNGTAEGQLVYHQKSLNENTGELSTTNIQPILRHYDAYYNFKNVSSIKHGGVYNHHTSLYT